MTYILHLETATKVCSVALSKNGVLIGKVESNDAGYSHGEKLTLFIEKVLQEAAITGKELTAISVTSGPGSYTGLRIGAATAKGLCYALGIPLISVGALESLGQQAIGKHQNVNLCAVIDARRMEVYNAFYNQDGEQIKSVSADIIDSASYSNFEPFVYFGDGAEKLKEVWESKNCKADYSILSSAVGHVKISYQKFKQEKFEDVAYFEPFYLKDFITGKKSSK